MSEEKSLDELEVIMSEEKSLDEMITTCDICGKTIIGIENFVDAGDKVVCSENCKQIAIGQFRHWENTPSLNWKRKEIK